MIELMPVLIGAGSLLVGVITFILTEISKSKRAIRSEIRQWQLDKIGAILSSQETTVADFGKVRTKYLENANAYKEFNIAKAYIQDNEIRRALFELQAKGIVLQDNDGNYRLRREATESETEKRFRRLMNDLERQWMMSCVL